MSALDAAILRKLIAAAQGEGSCFWVEDYGMGIETGLLHDDEDGHSLSAEEIARVRELVAEICK